MPDPLLLAALFLVASILYTSVGHAGASAYLAAMALLGVDAAVAGTSVAAQWLQSLRRIETWILWIVADLIAIPLYWSKGLVPTTILYCIFLGLAIAGLREWRRTLRQQAAA